MSVAVKVVKGAACVYLWLMSPLTLMSFLCQYDSMVAQTTR